MLIVVAVVVTAHHKVDLVGTHLGRHKIVRVVSDDVHKFSRRDFLAEIVRAVIGHRASLDIPFEFLASRGILDHGFVDIDPTARVLFALFSYNALFIDAGLVSGDAKLLTIVGAHIDKAQLARTLLMAFNVCTLGVKVSRAQDREGQLSFGLVHHNGIAVIQGGQGQGLAGKLCAVISADRSTVDVLDRLGEGDVHLGIADKVKLLGLLRHVHVVYAFHRAVCNDQLAQLLTISTVPAFDAAKAHRIGNRCLAVVTRQAAHDHGIPDDRSLRCIAKQNDILEHAAGDLSVISQFDRRVEHAAVDGAGLVEGNFPLEVSAFNNSVIEFDRSIGIHIGNRHVLQRNAIALQRCLSGVDFPRVQVHRVAVRAGDKDLRHGSVLAEFSGVLPAQTLIERDLHALDGHFLGLHIGQVGQTVFGNAQGLDRADIGRLVHQNILAVVVAGNMQHPALGRGIFIVVAELFIIVDADHIGVQRDICSACAHQIDGIGGKSQASAVYCSNIAVAHGQLAELLPGCQCSFNIVRQLAKHGIRNGKLAFTEKGSEGAVQNNCIGNSAFACAGQGVKGTAGNFNLAGVACRVDANTSIRIDAAGDLTAGKHQSALFAKRCVSNGGIGQLNRAVDGCRAQLLEVDLRTAPIHDLQEALLVAVVGVVVIGPAVAHVNTVQLCVRVLVQTVHIGHAVQVGLTRSVKAQLCIAGHHRGQLYGGIARKRNTAEAGREFCAVCTDRANPQ